jgi:hypothetical protein
MDHRTSVASNYSDASHNSKRSSNRAERANAPGSPRGAGPEKQQRPGPASGLPALPVSQTMSHHAKWAQSGRVRVVVVVLRLLQVRLSHVQAHTCCRCGLIRGLSTYHIALPATQHHYCGGVLHWCTDSPWSAISCVLLQLWCSCGDPSTHHPTNSVHVNPSSAPTSAPLAPLSTAHSSCRWSG